MQQHSMLNAVSPEIAISDPEIIASYCQDWTGRVIGQTHLVVRPRTHAEVAEVLNIARHYGETVLVQGGNTSLAGGSIPLIGEVLLSTERLTNLAIDPVSMTATVGAGVKLGDLQRALDRYGLSFGVDIASRESATLGGMTATNAGGIHVLRYGPMVENLYGVACVFGDGSTIEPHEPLVKDATGPSITRLLVGSEGIFGVITSVTLRLVPQPRHRTVALTPLTSVDEGVAISGHVRQISGQISAIEYLGPETLSLTSSPPPWRPAPGGALLLEAHASADELGVLLGSLGVEREWIVAEEPQRMEELWSWRERIPERISAVGKPLKLDLSVPILHLGELYRRAHDLASSTGVQCYCFGHLGDGNLHVNVIGPDPELARAVEHLYQVVVELSGSISAEHGIGTLKKDILWATKSSAELDHIARLIKIFNPERLVNPNVMLTTNKGGSHE